MVANGQLESPIATVESHFEVGEITFREILKDLKNLTSPLIGLLILQSNSAILTKRQWTLKFPFSSNLWVPYWVHSNTTWSTSQQHKKLSTQVSLDNTLPLIEHTPRNENSDSKNSINRLVEAIAWIATQQWRQAVTMLKTVSTNTIIFEGKNECFEFFEDLFHTMLKMQREMTEAVKINHFHAHLRNEALQTFRYISASNKNSWWRANCRSTKICHTRITSYS